MTLSDRSIHALEGVHPDLVRVVLRAAVVSPQRFIVTEGRRSLERQAQLIREGKSRLKDPTRSRHFTGHAVDLAVELEPGVVSWSRGDYKILAMSVKAAALELSIPLEWGGECFGASFFDGPHFQLPWKFYPVDPMAVPNLQPAGEVTKT
jgi:peptidoglycan L-alanyl-D-glutamate endopeptidase CwlK